MSTVTTVAPKSNLAARPSFREKYDHFINGEWVAPDSGEYFENIGEKLNPMLKMFETMFRLLEQINFMGMGKVFGFGANALADMQSKVDNKSRAENPLFNPNSGAVGSWDDSKKENLARGNSNLAQEIAKAFSSQQFDINVNDPGGIVESVKVNGKNYSGGIPAKTNSTMGVKP